MIHIDEGQVKIINCKRSLRLFLVQRRKSSRLAPLFDHVLISEASLAPECVAEEQDEGEKAYARNDRKEPEDGAPIESRCQYTSQY